MVQLIENTNKFSAFLVIGFGGIASIWTSCLFIANLQNQMRSDYYIRSGHNEYNTIIYSIYFTYLCIFIISSGALLQGFKKTLKSFLVPWTLLKFCENIVLVFGSFMLYYKWSFYGLVPLGIISFVINVYILLSIYKAFKKLESRKFIEEYENDLKGMTNEVIKYEKDDKESQTDPTNVIIEIKKQVHNVPIKNNNDSPHNYIHTSISNTGQDL